MDLQAWKTLLLQWVQKLNGFETVECFDNININDFFTIYARLASIEPPLEHFATPQEALQSFLKVNYPDFQARFELNGHIVIEDYTYIYTIFMHYTCVQNPCTLFQNMCRGLPEKMHPAIYAFFRQTVNTVKLTRERLHKLILNIQEDAGNNANDSVLSINTTDSAPNDNEASSSSKLNSFFDAPPTPKTERLDQCARQLISLRAELEAERYDKSCLEEQHLRDERNIEALIKENKRLEKLKTELQNMNETNSTDGGNDAAKHLEELKLHLQFMSHSKDEMQAELNEQIIEIKTEREKVSDQLHSTDQQLRICLERIGELELRLDSMNQLMIVKDNSIRSLQHENSELCKCLLEHREEAQKGREVLNASSDLLDTSQSAGSMNTTPENLGSSVIDKQLREKQQENDELHAQLASNESVRIRMLDDLLQIAQHHQMEIPAAPHDESQVVSLLARSMRQLSVNSEQQQQRANALLEENNTLKLKDTRREERIQQLTAEAKRLAEKLELVQLNLLAREKNDREKELQRAADYEVEQQRAHQLQAEIDSLKLKDRRSEGQIQKLLGEAKNLADELDLVKADLQSQDELQAEINTLKLKDTRSEQQIQHLTAETKKLADDLRLARSDLIAREKTDSEKNVQHAADLEVEQQQLEVLQVEFNSLKQKNMRNEEHIQELNGEAKRLADELQLLKNREKQQDVQNVQLSADYEVEKQRVAELQLEINALKLKDKRSEEHVRKLDGEARRLAGELQVAASDIQTREKSDQLLDRQLAEMSCALSKYIRQKTAPQERIITEANSTVQQLQKLVENKLFMSPEEQLTQKLNDLKKKRGRTQTGIEKVKQAEKMQRNFAAKLDDNHTDKDIELLSVQLKTSLRAYEEVMLKCDSLIEKLERNLEELRRCQERELADQQNAEMNMNNIIEIDNRQQQILTQLDVFKDEIRVIDEKINNQDQQVAAIHETLRANNPENCVENNLATIDLLRTQLADFFSEYEVLERNNEYMTKYTTEIMAAEQEEYSTSQKEYVLNLNKREADCEEMRQQLLHKSKEVDSLMQELETKSSSQLIIENKLREVQRKFLRALDDAKQHKQLVSGLENKLKAELDIRENVQLELEQQNHRLESQTNRLETVEKDLAEQKSILEQTQRELAEAREAQQEQEKLVNALRKEMEDSKVKLKLQLQLALDELEQHKQRVLGLENELKAELDIRENLQLELEQQNHRVESQTNRLETVDKDLVEQKYILEQTQRELAEARDAQQEQEKLFNALRNDLEDSKVKLKLQLQLALDELEQHKQRVLGLENELKAELDIRENLQLELEQQNHRVESQTNRLETVDKDLAEQKSILEQTQRELAEARDAQQEQETLVNALRKEMEDSKVELQLALDELEQHKQTVLGLENELKAERDIRENVQLELEQQNHRVESKTNRLETVDKDLAEQKSILEQTQRELAEARDAQQEQETLVNALRKEMEDSKVELQMALDELEQHKHRVLGLENELKAERDIRENLQLELEQQNHRVESQTNRLETVDKDLAEQKSILEQTQRELAEARDAQQERETLVNALRKEMEDSKLQLQLALDELEQHKQQVSGLENKLKAELDIRENLQLELEQQNHRVESQTNRLETVDKDLVEQKSILEQTQRELAEARDAQQEQEKLVNALRNDLEDSKVQLQMHIDRANQAEKRVSTLEVNYSISERERIAEHQRVLKLEKAREDSDHQMVITLEKENVELTLEIGALNTNVKQQQEKVSDLNAQLQLANDTIAKVVQELDQQRIMFQTVQCELDDKLNLLKAEREKSCERESHYQRSLQAIKEELQECQADNIDMRDNYESLLDTMRKDARESKPEDIGLERAKSHQLELDCKILQAKYRDAKEEIGRWEQKLKDQRLEMEGKLEKMKSKMRTLYNAEVTRMKEKQERDVASNKLEMEKLIAQTARFENHTKKLSNQVVRLNENILEHMSQNAMLSTKLAHLERCGNQAMSAPSVAAGPSDAAAGPSGAAADSSGSAASTSAGAAGGGDWQPFKRPCVPSANLGGNLAMEDEEGEVFNNTYLTDLKLGRGPEMTTQELQYRNSLQPPHLKSAYAAQYDLDSQESEVKDGAHGLDDSMSALLSTTDGNGGARKKTSGTHYKRPGPPTPSKHGGRLSFGSSEPPREILRESNDNNNSAKTPARFRIFTSRFSLGTERARRRILARHKQESQESVFCTSTPRKTGNLTSGMSNSSTPPTTINSTSAKTNSLPTKTNDSKPGQIANTSPANTVNVTPHNQGSLKRGRETDQEEDVTPHLSKDEVPPRRQRCIEESFIVSDNMFAIDRARESPPTDRRLLHQLVKVRQQRNDCHDRARNLTDGDQTYSVSVPIQECELQQALAMVQVATQNGSTSEQSRQTDSTDSLEIQQPRLYEADDEDDHLGSWPSVTNSPPKRRLSNMFKRK